MIKTFGNKETQALYEIGKSCKLPNKVLAATLRKLDMINAAEGLIDLRAPPSNRLEALRGSLKGFYSIRINNQWRIIFKWNKGAEQVEIIDYH